MVRVALSLLLAVGLAGCVTVERDISAEATRAGTTVIPMTIGGTPRQMVNAIRAQNGLPPLAMSAHLNRAAAAHASDMARNDYYSHTSRNGATVRDRVEATGYGSCLRAENIAWGQDTAEHVTRVWINSPGHRANILNRKATHMGFAGSRNPDGRYDPLWVMVIATRNC
ncbi:MAG: CAP domain-containing protein [Pseudomonadota bacterium]